MEISTKNMLWRPQQSQFVSEASDLQLKSFPDQLVVNLHLTGEKRIFTRQSLDRDREGEIQSATYVSAGCEVSLVILSD